MASEDMSKKKDTFVVRHARSLEDLQWVIKMATEEEGFAPREKEAECYFLAGLTPYFYIGELNEERISCMSLVRHRESYVVGGYNIAKKSYRGKGYGKRMLEVGLKDVGDQRIQTFAPESSVNPYQKSGYQPGWMVKVYQFDASCAVEFLASRMLPPSVEQILPASQVDFEKLFAYGADMLGTSQTCKSLLAAWLCHLQESSWAAIDKNGEVVGYLIMSKTTCFSEEGYLIAPFYANSAPIARSLLKVAAAFACANNPRKTILKTKIPIDYNPEGVSILEKELGAKPVFDLTFMTNKEGPNRCLSKVFSMASTSVL